MGCGCSNDDVNGGVPSKDGAAYASEGIEPPVANQRKRNKKHYYVVHFPRRPLHITLTSSKDNNDGYITAVEEQCPVDSPIAINSKVIFVNGVLVEGLEVQEIAKHLSSGQLPLKLKLCHPNGLERDEVPDIDPRTIVHMQNQTN